MYLSVHFWESKYFNRAAAGPEIWIAVAFTKFSTFSAYVGCLVFGFLAPKLKSDSI
jgi:hypothetical protein